ncbi:MAG: DUF362 domain-containing protein [Gemmatimonadetes bacterium]|nr:DUF362 domain-containing protein [Gemmatimonadota bacterium]
MTRDSDHDGRGEKMPRTISRRQVLTGLGGLAGLSALGWRPRFEGTRSTASVVGVARGRTTEEALRTAVELGAGLEFIRPGQTVLIKPNFCSPVPHPATTSPEMLVALLNMVWERDPRRVIVGDQTFYVQNTLANVRRNRLDQAVREGRGELVPFDDVPRRQIRPPAARYWPEGYRVPALLAEVDHLINLACVKTHSLARFTMSMKNVIGVIDAESRRYYHGRRREQGYEFFAAMIAQMCLAIQPSLNILEGTKAFVTGGPSDGDLVEPRLVIASRDRIAADVTGLAVLRHHGAEPAVQDISPWGQPKIREGIALGLGAADRSQVEVRSRGVEEIQSIERWMA